VQNFKELKVWEKSHRVVLSIYKITEMFSKEELFGLTSQMRRAAYSIPTNIAEGCGRNGNADFIRFLHISMGSACELEYLLMLAFDLALLKRDDLCKLENEVTEIKRMLTSFISKIKEKSN
jgi:four helix bundle protein